MPFLFDPLMYSQALQQAVFHLISPSASTFLSLNLLDTAKTATEPGALK